MVTCRYLVDMQSFNNFMEGNRGYVVSLYKSFFRTQYQLQICAAVCGYRGVGNDFGLVIVDGLELQLSNFFCGVYVSQHTLWL